MPNHTMPTGFAAVPPSGPATPLTATITGAENYGDAPATYHLAADDRTCTCGTTGPAYVGGDYPDEAHCLDCAMTAFEYYTELIAPPAGRKVIVINPRGYTEVRYPTTFMFLDFTKGLALVVSNLSITTHADEAALAQDAKAYGVKLDYESDYESDEQGWEPRPGIICPPAQLN